MADINTITITGRLGQQPELHEFQSGSQVCSLSVATNHWDKREGKELTTWLTVKVFGKSAEYVNNNALKGGQVTINGTLRIEEWTDKQTQQKRSKPVILANNVILPPREKDSIGF